MTVIQREGRRKRHKKEGQCEKERREITYQGFAYKSKGCTRTEEVKREA